MSNHRVDVKSTSELDQLQSAGVTGNRGVVWYQNSKKESKTS